MARPASRATDRPQVTADKLQMRGALVARSYMEAVGMMAAHKAGVNPACLTADVHSIRDLHIS
jgi:hypothetical protein|eukprot:3577740-Prymnesium_polylepis.1